MRGYTTISQSKKLLELGLKPESADMYYNFDVDFTTGELYFPADGSSIMVRRNNKPLNLNLAIPCWSLAALLGVLPDYTLQTNTDGTVFVVCESKNPMISDAYDNPVDACYELILKLNELKML